MAFFDQKSWMRGRENVASLVAAAWTIAALAVVIALMNLDVSALPLAHDKSTFRIRVITLWPPLAFMSAVIFGVIMGFSRYRMLPYVVAFLLSVASLMFCCLAMLRSGYVIADQHAIFRNGEPWEPDQIVSANRAVGLLRGCDTIRGKVTSYAPIYKLVVVDRGRYKAYDLGQNVSDKDAPAWVDAISGLRLPALQFTRNIGGNRFSDNPRDETEQVLRQDDDFTECISAYRKSLDSRRFSAFSRLVGSPM